MREYVRIIRKRWVTVALVLAVFLAAGVLYTSTRDKVYEASAQIFVSTADASDVSQLAQGNIFTQARVQSYTAVAVNPEVTQSVVASLGLSMSPSDLAKKISADAPLNKVLINLHVTDGSPRLAATIANAVAARFISVVESIERPENGSSAVKLTVNQPASVPASPISPNVSLNVALSVVVGLLVGFGLAVIRDLFDNTYKSAEELSHAAQAPVLATVPLDRRVQNATIAFRDGSHSARAEAFRQLRINLQFVDVDNPPKVIAVCSAIPGEGKTHTAINLAAALAEAGSRVCLLEADLRRPTVARLLGLISDVGLTTALIGQAQVEEVVQNAGDNLAVLTSGQTPPNPGELLASDQCRRIVDSIAAAVDYLIIDTAPLLLVADGAEIATLADATILTVRFGKTSKEQVRRALVSLRNVGVSPVGTVLSMASGRSGDDYTYGYYYGYESRDSSVGAIPAKVTPSTQ